MLHLLPISWLFTPGPQRRQELLKSVGKSPTWESPAWKFLPVLYPKPLLLLGSASAQPGDSGMEAGTDGEPPVLPKRGNLGMITNYNNFGAC